jgi:hypothetical protein
MGSSFAVAVLKARSLGMTRRKRLLLAGKGKNKGNKHVEVYPD